VFIIVLFSICIANLSDIVDLHAAQKKQILVLNSGEYENLWTSGILNKLRNNFVFNYSNFQLNIENINFNENKSWFVNCQDFSDYLSKKYTDVKFDLIITIGDEALAYTGYVKGRIFKGIPVLFSGVYFVDSSTFNPQKGFSGISTNISFLETIRMYLSLTPQRKNLIVLFDSSQTGKLKRQLILPALNKLKRKNYQVSVFENLTLESFLNKIKDNQDSSIIFLAGRFKNEFNSFGKLDLSAEILSKKCDIPIYSLHSQLVRSGIVSDRIPNAASDGELLTTEAVKVLQGTPIGQIPVIYSRNLRYIFDYKRLRDFDIDIESIPENSIILNREESFLEKYLGYLLFLGGIIISSIIIITLVKNIRGRKKAEKILKESEERFKEIYENSTVGIYRITPGGKVMMANPAFIKIFGYDSFEILSLLNFELECKQAGFDREKFKTRLEKESIIRDYNYPWKRRDDTIVYLKENAKVYRKSDGTVSYYEGIVEDVTERKKAEDARAEYIEELKQSKEVIEKSARELKELNLKLYSSEEKLKALNKSKDKFFSLISHDLRSPLNSVMGFTEILAENLDELNNNEIKSFAENIHSLLKNLHKLIENLLQWSSLQTGRFEFNPVNLNIHRLCREIFDLISGNALKKRISLVNLIPPDLNVFADEFMIYSVLQNLISNAIKYTNPGGKIIVKAVHNEKLSIITVHDNGIGISEKEIQNLFSIESTYSKNGTNGESGTGLGLILCKELIEMNKGNIRVESEVGRGSDFIFTLPLAYEETKKV
jgi:PAS domain S-box-containing protein